MSRAASGTTCSVASSWGSTVSRSTSISRSFPSSSCPGRWPGPSSGGSVAPASSRRTPIPTRSAPGDSCWPGSLRRSCSSRCRAASGASTCSPRIPERRCSARTRWCAGWGIAPRSRPGPARGWAPRWRSSRPRRSPGSSWTCPPCPPRRDRSPGRRSRARWWPARPSGSSGDGTSRWPRLSECCGSAWPGSRSRRSSCSVRLSRGGIPRGVSPSERRRSRPRANPSLSSGGSRCWVASRTTPGEASFPWARETSCATSSNGASRS